MPSKGACQKPGRCDGGWSGMEGRHKGGRRLWGAGLAIARNSGAKPEAGISRTDMKRNPPKDIGMANGRFTKDRQCGNAGECTQRKPTKDNCRTQESAKA